MTFENTKVSQIINTFRTPTKDMNNAGVFVWCVSIKTTTHPDGIILNKELDTEEDAHRYGVRQYHMIMDELRIERLQEELETKVAEEGDAYFAARDQAAVIDALSPIRDRGAEERYKELRYAYSQARTATNEARETVEIAKAGCKIPTPAEAR